MDAALLKEREAFKKRAMMVPVVDKKPIKNDVAHTNGFKEAPKKSRPPQASPKLDANTYKTIAGSSQYRFGVLAKIVKHMRLRHLDGDDHPLTIDEIIDETNQLDIVQTVKHWLVTEALVNNPKIEVVNSSDGPRYMFKPVYRLKDGKSLIRLLKLHDLKGLGGIMLEDVQESLPHWEKVLKNRASEILFIVRPLDKKKVLFYNDKSCTFNMDEEFQKLWRSITVDALDDNKIEEYLEKQGIRSMQDNCPKKLVHKRKTNTNKKRVNKKPRDNEHMIDVLETYDDNTLTQKGVNPSDKTDKS